jgi:uncharacterized Zn finger protein
MAKRSKQRAKAGSRWRDLTWDDLDGSFGEGAMTRGRTYQRSGRVSDLACSAKGVSCLSGGLNHPLDVSVHGGSV